MENNCKSNSVFDNSVSNRIEFESPDVSEPRPTLMMSLERLNSVCDQMDALLDLTETTNEKLNGTYGMKCEGPNGELLAKEVQPETIVELFNYVARRLEKSISTASINVNRTINTID